MPVGAELIQVTMMRIDGEEGDARPRKLYRLKKMINVGGIKERNQLEFGIEPHEQVIIFRGMQIERDNRAQPFCTPDLQDIIEEAGEEGLQMAVAYKPKRLPGFLENEKLEEINGRFKTGGSALHRAARRIELGVMEELLEHPEFELINAADDSEQTSLHTSAACWNREACEIMLKCKKFELVNARDGEGRTALHIVAFWGDVQTTKLILDHELFTREDISVEDIHGTTALAYAKSGGHSEVAELISGALTETDAGNQSEDAPT